jgi:hypothetical protein
MTLNFQARFAPDVEAGLKTLTLRCSPTALRCKVGDTVHLFTGMRTKACRRLGTGKVKRVRWVQIKDEHTTVIDGQILSRDQLRTFAAADGFGGPAEQAAWFDKQYGLPFDLVAIEWDLIKSALALTQDLHAPAGAESFAANTQPAGASSDSKACCCTTNDCPLPKVRRSGAEAQYGTFTCPPSCRAKEKVSHRGTEGTEA